jgi:hypothetical protein
MLRSSYPKWFSQSRKQVVPERKVAACRSRFTSVRVLAVLAAVTVFAVRAHADAVIPVIIINPQGASLSFGGTVIAPTTLVVEGGEAFVFIRVTNPSTTAPLSISSLNISIPASGRKPDLGDQLTLAGATLLLNSCVVPVPGIANGRSASIPASSSCLDVIVLPTIDNVADETPADKGTTEVDAVVIAPNGNSVPESADLEVTDVPESTSLLMLGSGLLALTMAFRRKRLKDGRNLADGVLHRICQRAETLSYGN